MFPLKRFYLAGPLAVLLVAFILFSTSVAANNHAESICDVPGDYSTIQAAVNDPACETINLGASTFHENVSVARAVTIQGQGAANTRVDGSASGSVFCITASAVVTLSHMTITNGSAASGGGIAMYAGVLESKTVHLIDSTITGNSATSGGGIYSGAYRFGDTAVYVTNSTLSGNMASDYGGGIYNAGYAQVYVTNSTLSGNSASSGGGIANAGGGVVIANGTLSDNSASQGGGIYNVWYNEAPYGGYRYFGVTHSLVANSPSGGDCVNDVDAGFGDNGYNLVEDGTCISASTSSSGDPVLGPLQDNGGPTWTHALLPGSPAIDTGGEICPDTDQRGVSRPQDGDEDGVARCDIGAFEMAREFLMFLPFIER